MKQMKDQVVFPKLLARVDGLTTESKLKLGFSQKPSPSSQALSPNSFFQKCQNRVSNPNFSLLFSFSFFLHLKIFVLLLFGEKYPQMGFLILKSLS